MRALVFALSILFSLTACNLLSSAPAASLNQQAAPTPTSYPTPQAAARPTFTVQRGTVQEVASFTGRWLPRDQYALAFESAGTLRSVKVQRGDTVTAGQLLADYDTTELLDQLASAELELETVNLRLASGEESGRDALIDARFALADANLSLQSRQNNYPWTSLESARLALEEARRQLRDAQRAYDDAISRADSSASAVDSAYQALQSAQAGVKSAELSYYGSAQSFNQHEYSIAGAENAVLRSQLELEEALNGGGISPEDIQSLRAAQMNLEQVKEKIRRASLYAPVDGVVLEVSVQPGDQVESFRTVMVIARPEPGEVISNIPFNDTQRLDVGMVGVCQLPNRPETAVQCAIRQLPLSSRDVDQSVRIGAQLDKVTQMALGQVVEVEMPLQTRENVLWLPPQAIRNFQNRTFVVVLTSDGERVVDVTLGLQTQERVEIISGLAEGDVIVAQ